jgi:hypothetical protein
MEPRKVIALCVSVDSSSDVLHAYYDSAKFQTQRIVKLGSSIRDAFQVSP